MKPIHVSELKDAMDKLQKGRSKSKYKNKKCWVDGLKFDSQKEAARWKQLQLLEQSGRIRNLERQVMFDLVVNGTRICGYRADFVYEERNGWWRDVVEDTKGKRTNEYLIKKKLMLACHGIEIRES